MTPDEPVAHDAREPEVFYAVITQAEHGEKGAYAYAKSAVCDNCLTAYAKRERVHSFEIIKSSRLCVTDCCQRLVRAPSESRLERIAANERLRSAVEQADQSGMCHDVSIRWLKAAILNIKVGDERWDHL